jgi:hypothetical protein
MTQFVWALPIKEGETREPCRVHLVSQGVIVNYEFILLGILGKHFLFSIVAGSNQCWSGILYLKKIHTILFMVLGTLKKKFIPSWSWYWVPLKFSYDLGHGIGYL